MENTLWNSTKYPFLQIGNRYKVDPIIIMSSVSVSAMASGKFVGWWQSSGVIFQLEDKAILWEWQPCWVPIQGSAPCKVNGEPHGMASLVLGSQAEASLAMAATLIPRVQRMGSRYILCLHCAEVGHPCGFILKGKGGAGEQRQLRHFSVWKETQQTEWDGSVFLHVSECFSLHLYWGLDEEALVCSGEAPQDKGCSLWLCAQLPGLVPRESGWQCKLWVWV